MGKFSFGDASLAQIATCHMDMQLILVEALHRSPIDFGVSQGRRTIEEQRQFFREGKSRINPDDPEQLKRSKHLCNPSMAADIYISVPARVWPDGKKLAYDVAHLSLVAGVIISVANELYEKGAIKHKVRWGGDWDGDGCIIVDQDFDDLPHFELVGA
jgi:peptidoglycan L-alanyl-D-glutamate endopeptidase CwlK